MWKDKGTQNHFEVHHTYRTAQRPKPFKDISFFNDTCLHCEFTPSKFARAFLQLLFSFSPWSYLKRPNKICTYICSGKEAKQEDSMHFFGGRGTGTGECVRLQHGLIWDARRWKETKCARDIERTIYDGDRTICLWSAILQFTIFSHSFESPFCTRPQIQILLKCSFTFQSRLTFNPSPSTHESRKRKGIRKTETTVVNNHMCIHRDRLL